MNLAYLFIDNTEGKDISDFMCLVNSNAERIDIADLHTLIEHTVLIANAKKNQMPVPLPLNIFECLPDLLRNPLNKYKSYDEKELILLSTIATLSSLMPNYFTVYNNLKQESNLYLFIVGKAASGKGLMNDARIISKLIQDTTCTTSYNDTKLSERKVIFIPADTSAAGFYQLLKANNERGLVFESEADVLNETMKKEWGSYSTILRKAFHHEPVSVARKTDDEYLELNHPKITCIISGTIEQAKNFLQIENGLFSRFMLFYLGSTSGWKNVFSTNAVFNPLNTVADWMLKNYNYFQENEIQFSFTTEQQEIFNNFMESQLENFRIYDATNDLESSIKRLGLILVRISMILTIIEEETLEGLSSLLCSSSAFHALMLLAEFLISHLLYVYKLVNSTNNEFLNAQNQAQQLINILPKQFTTKKAKEIGNTIGIKEDYIYKILRSKKHFKKTNRGLYEKI